MPWWWPMLAAVPFGGWWLARVVREQRRRKRIWTSRQDTQQSRDYWARRGNEWKP